MRRLLPRNLSEIPRLDLDGFNEEGTIRFVPQVGSNYIRVYKYVVPYIHYNRRHLGIINLQGKN